MPTTDKNGREILPGDTLKVYHFTGGRCKKHFMYKYVQEVVPGRRENFFRISHLNIQGETYLMRADGKQHDDIEIVQGFGNSSTPFDERPRFRGEG